MERERKGEGREGRNEGRKGERKEGRKERKNGGRTEGESEGRGTVGRVVRNSERL